MTKRVRKEGFDLSQPTALKIKIVHLSSFDLGIVFLLPQLRALQAEGFEVHAMCGLGPWTPALEAEGLKVHPIKVAREISPVADVRLLWAISKVLRRENFAIVHAHTPKLEIVGQLAARLVGVPIVLYTNHGFFFRGHMSRIRREFIKTMARGASYFSDHILSQSSEDIQLALEQKIYRADRVSYLGNGIDISVLNSARFTPEEILLKKREIGIPEHHKVVGMVGRYVWEKGYREFFEAVATLAKGYSDVSFLTVGTSLASERDPVDFQILRRLNIQDRVTILKSRGDMPDLYALMDMLVLPSYREGFPRTLMEAAAMSKPTIATDIAGCREAVIDGFNGWLVPVRNGKALAEKIRLLLDDPRTAAGLGINGRTLAEERFDIQKVIERLMSCYRFQLSQKLLAYRSRGTMNGESQNESAVNDA